jgi:hypothetical protein
MRESFSLRIDPLRIDHFLSTSIASCSAKNSYETSFR